MDVQQYLEMIAGFLVDELRPVLNIEGVTKNTDLLGKYAEASVRRLVHRIVSPMRVSTGAVLDYPLPKTLRQIDLIIWAPFPAPALFDVEGFGLVPKSSAFGVMEIKKSNYTGVDTKLERFLSEVDAGQIISEAAGAVADFRRRPGMGVVCVLESPSSRLRS